MTAASALSYVPCVKDSTTASTVATKPTAVSRSTFTLLCYVLGPEGASDVIDSSYVRYHSFADDMQIYRVTRLKYTNELRQLLSVTVAWISERCANQRLQLNAAKTELLSLL